MDYLWKKYGNKSLTGLFFEKTHYFHMCRPQGKIPPPPSYCLIALDLWLSFAPCPELIESECSSAVTVNRSRWQSRAAARGLSVGALAKSIF
jgi:hypothetical protein